MSAHTHGPWGCDRRNFRNEPDPHNWYVLGNYQDADPDDPDDCPSCIAIATVHGNPTSGGIPEANARLIAAAPELLEACRMLLNSHECIIEDGEFRTDEGETARRAIAKAEGKVYP